MASNDFVISTHGVRSPRIIYGTAWKKTRTEDLVARAIRQGFRGIDTACQPKHYYEPGVGAAVSACLNEGLRREDLYLQTKFTPLAGQDPEQIPYDSQARLAEQVAQSFRTSTRNLRTSQVDCLVLHSPLSDEKQMTEVWQAMELIFDGGGARQLGISNCYNLEYLQALCRSARVPPAVVQNRFYSETDYDRGIRAFCRQQRIIYQSFWTLTANPDILGHKNVKALALAHGRTPAQILFRCLTQQDVVPLTGTKTEAHLREDLEIFEFELRPEELDVVRSLF